MPIAHITDLHVSDDGKPVHDLVDTDAAIRAVVAALNALDLALDVVLATGNVTHAGDGIALACTLLRRPTSPVPVCTGNHDRRAGLRAAFGRRADDRVDASDGLRHQGFPRTSDYCARRRYLRSHGRRNARRTGEMAGDAPRQTVQPADNICFPPSVPG